MNNKVIISTFEFEKIDSKVLDYSTESFEFEYAIPVSILSLQHATIAIWRFTIFSESKHYSSTRKKKDSSVKNTNYYLIEE